MESENEVKEIELKDTAEALTGNCSCHHEKHQYVDMKIKSLNEGDIIEFSSGLKLRVRKVTNKDYVMRPCK
jgi:uncharacterized protein YkvS